MVTRPAKPSIHSIHSIPSCPAGTRVGDMRARQRVPNVGLRSSTPLFFAKNLEKTSKNFPKPLEKRRVYAILNDVLRPEASFRGWLGMRADEKS